MYTLRLSDLIEIRGGSCTIVDGVRVLDKPDILHLDTYPLHDEAHRTELNGFILDTFWNREIAYESADMFVGKLRSKMRLIMPSFNQLYESASLTFNPLHTTDMLNTATNTADSTSQRDSSADSSSTQDGESRSVSSDTPSTMLAEDGHYASAAVDGRNASVTTGTASDEATSADHAESSAEARSVGYAGISPATLLQSYREAIINVDQMILAELEPHFLALWGTPHTFNDWNRQ